MAYFEDDENNIYEETAYFVGICTCGHDQEEHGWFGCDVDDCECEARWEE